MARRVLKWTGISFGGLVALLALALGAVYAVSGVRLSKTYAVALTPLPEAADADAVARGRHKVTIRGCMDCHGDDYGGRLFLDDPAIGTIYAPNLTPGGTTARFSDADWDRAIRHGVRPDGRALLVMPSREYHGISDADLADMVAYLRSLPPVERVAPPPRVGPLGRILYVAGVLPLANAEQIDHRRPRPSAPPPGPTAAYGAYLAAGCTGCHGQGFSGGKIPAAPPDFAVPTNLTRHPTGIPDWTEADFMRALRTGRRPDGTALDPTMPWKITAQMTDDEIRAIYRYLRTVPPRPEGTR